MTVKDCLQILRDVKDCAFATVDENGSPQNRIIDVMMADDNGIYFLTARGKHFYSQITDGKTAAVTTLYDKWQTVRLVGTVERLSPQKEWIDKFFELNPSMNSVYPNDSRYILEPFCIKNGEVEFFDLSDEPIYRKSFVLGNGEVTPKGFVISDECIECGLCQTNCPQQCIEEGTPFAIHQNNCLHCGLCFENCPVQAIKRIEDQG